MDLQMVGEGQGALMGSGWMLKGNGGEFLSCLSRLKAIACVKKDFSKNNSYYY